jgi:hypothetical protein
MASTPPSQVRPSAAAEDGSDAGDVNQPDMGVHSDHETSDDEDDYSDFSTELSSAASLTINAAEEDRKLSAMLSVGDEPPARGQSVSQWCFAPCAVLFVLALGIGGALGYVGHAIDESHNAMSRLLAERGAITAAATYDALLDLTNNVTAASATADAIRVAHTLTFAKETVGDAQVVAIAPNTSVYPMSASIFGPLLCASCPINARLLPFEADAWWARAPSHRSDRAILDNKIDPAIGSASSAAMIALAVPAGAAWKKMTLQYSVAHVVADGVIASQVPRAFPSAAAAGCVMGIVLAWVCVVAALELLDRFFLRRWERKWTETEKDKAARLDEGEELDEDESDVPPSAVSSARAASVTFRQRAMRCTAVGAVTFSIVLLWGCSGVALTFAPSKADVANAQRVVLERSENNLRATAVDELIIPRIQQRNQSLGWTAALAAANTMLADATAARSLGDAVAHSVETEFSDRLATAIGIAVGTAIVAALAAAVGVALANPIPQPLSTLLRRTAAGSFYNVVSPRLTRLWTTLLSVRFITGVLFPLALLCAAGGTAAGSVVLLRQYTTARLEAALKIAAQIDARAPITPLGLDSNRESYSISVDLRSPLNAFASLSGTDDVVRSCGEGFAPGSNLTIRAPLNLRLQLSGQPAISSNHYGDVLMRQAKTYAEQSELDLRPLASERTRYGLWARSSALWSADAVTATLVLVGEDWNAGTRNDIVSTTPAAAADQTYARLRRASFPRVVWIPLAAAAAFLLLFNTLSDTLLNVAQKLRRNRGSIGTAKLTVFTAVSVAVIGVAALVWPITASITLRQEWSTVSNAAPFPELHAASQSLVQTALLGSIRRRLAVINASALPAWDTPIESAPTSVYRASSSIILVSRTVNGTFGGSEPFAVAFRNPGLDECGSRFQPLCSNVFTGELRRVAAMSAGSAASSVGEFGGVHYGYAAVVTANQGGDTFVVEAMVVVGGTAGDTAADSGLDYDAAEQALAVRVIATVSFTFLAAFVLIIAVLLPTLSNGKFKAPAQLADRPIRLTSGFYTNLPLRHAGAAPQLAPVVGLWHVGRYLPLPLRRREMWFVLSFAATLLVAASVADLSLGDVRSSIDHVALTLSTSASKDSSRGFNTADALNAVASVVQNATVTQAANASSAGAAMRAAAESIALLRGSNISSVGTPNSVVDIWASAAGAVENQLDAVLVQLLTVVSWIDGRASARAAGTADATVDALWSNPPSSFMDSVRNATDATTAAIVRVGQLAGVTTLPPALFIAALDSDLDRAATAATTSVTRASALAATPPAAITQALTAAASTLQSLRPPSTLELSVALVAAALGVDPTLDVTVNARTYSPQARQVATLIVAGYQVGLLRRRFGTSLARLQAAAAALSTLPLQSCGTTGDSPRDLTARDARMAASALTYLTPYEDHNLPIIALVCFAGALLITAIVSSLLHRIEAAQLGGYVGMIPIITTFVLAAIVSCTFMGGLYVVTSDVSEAISAEVRGPSSARAAALASAASVVASVDDVLNAVAADAMAMGADMTSVVAAVAVAKSAALRHLAHQQQLNEPVTKLLTALDAVNEASWSAARVNADAVARGTALFVPPNRSASTVQQSSSYDLVEALVSLDAATSITADMVRALPTWEYVNATVPARIVLTATAGVEPLSSTNVGLTRTNASTPFAELSLAIGAFRSQGNTAALATAAHLSLLVSTAAASLVRALSCANGLITTRALGAAVVGLTPDLCVANTLDAVAASSKLRAAVASNWTTMASGGASPTASEMAALQTIDAVANATFSLLAEMDMDASLQVAFCSQYLASANGTHSLDVAAAIMLNDDGRPRPSSNARLSALIRGIPVEEAPLLLLCSAGVRSPAPQQPPLVSASSGLLAAAAALSDVTSGAFMSSVYADDAAPWARVWLHYSKAHSGSVGAPSNLDRPTAQITTLTPAEDTVQRLAIGGVWLIVAIAAGVAVLMRLVV